MKPPEPWTDALLDAALGDVAVPAGLTERLRPEALFDHASLDRILADLPVPQGLAVRLRGGSLAPPTRIVDGRPAALDRAGRPLRWLRAAVRDALAVALSLGIVAAMVATGGLVAELARRPAAARPSVAMTRAKPAAPRTGPATLSEKSPPRRSGPGREAVLEAERLTAHADPTVPPDAPSGSPGGRRTAVPPAVRTAPLPDAADPARSTGKRSAGPFTGMQVVPDEGPPDDASSRRFVPRMRGFDAAFEMAHGEAPFVDPSIAPGLRVDRPPLVLATDSFDRVWPLPSGRRRQADLESLRVEHLFAALTRPVADDDGAAVALGLSAVRSLRPGRPTYLVEVRIDVPAARVPVVDPDATRDAMLVLDHSAAPAALPLWQAACRGLAAAAERMTQADRLTVVVAEPRPRVVAIRAPAEEILRLAAELEMELPFGIADLDAAVRLALETAARERLSPRLVVVAHSERAERCVGAGREPLDRWREAAARDQTGEDVPRFLLVSGVPDGISAASVGMPGWSVSDPTTLRRRLTETLVDRPARVVTAAAVDVRFDPGAIAAYRIVGHRQGVPESLAAFGRAIPSGSTTTIHEGETARVIYEVVPRQAPERVLAGISATFTCREPSGTPRALSASGAPLDQAPGGLPSPAGCELLLSVGIGEFPGRSVHALPRRAAVDGLRELAFAWERRGDVTVVGRRLIELFAEAAAGSGASAGP